MCGCWLIACRLLPTIVPHACTSHNQQSITRCQSNLAKLHSLSGSCHTWPLQQWLVVGRRTAKQLCADLPQSPHIAQDEDALPSTQLWTSQAVDCITDCQPHAERHHHQQPARHHSLLESLRQAPAARWHCRTGIAASGRVARPSTFRCRRRRGRLRRSIPLLGLSPCPRLAV